jgi:Zn-dependent M28 family amino/carboxypeptidase
VVLSGAPPTFPPDQRAHYSSGTTKFRGLVDRGAVGVIFVDTPIDEKRFPWERVLQMSWRPSMRWVDAAGTPFNSFPGIKARFAFSRAGATKLFAGAPSTLEQVFAKSEAGKAQAFDLPAELTLSSTTELVRMSSPNVAGVIEGSDAALKGEFVVFTAHLDHIGQGAPVSGDAIYNGAFDNASGIAVLLETARYFAELPRKPRRSMLFLAVTAEEQGLLGSEYFARQPTVPREAIVANVNMDMPLALTEVADVVAFGAEHSSLGGITARAVGAEGMTISPDPMPEEVVFVRSDQYSFVREGIPAVYLDMGTHSRVAGVDGGKLVEQFLRERYHMPGDDLSQPIHYESLASLARINARIGLDVGNARERPKWNPGDFFGDLFTRPAAASK